jgi:D-2-hydroxyacid dehydrogenase (NADP+)
MREVNLLITFKSADAYTQHRMEDEYLQQIKKCSKNINLFVTDLTHSDTEQESPARKELDSFLEKAEVIFGHRLPKNLVKRAPRLKWFQAMSAGIDLLLDDELCNSEVILTNMSGISAVAVAESALALMLALAKNLQLCFEQKQHKLWRQFHPRMLESSTIGIVGLGSIGRDVAHLAHSFGMKVVVSEYSLLPSAKTKNVDLVLTPDQLPQLLAMSDYVVICLPLTDQTRGLIGEAQLRSMKPTACIINISRGHIIDERALVKALKEKWIAGAGMDVFSREPLEADSELWSLPNMIITPHVAGFLTDYNKRTTDFFCKNMKRYLKGKKLLNVVDKKKGF